ncbi:MAG: hypothetical protein VX130_01440 [Verrucomicrobiota bacterium]|nr:hypothetical protein [Verrucomicrobiota bacterium]
MSNSLFTKYVIAEVWIDRESLAYMLEAKGLAKDYDEEGPRPEW